MTKRRMFRHVAALAVVFLGMALPARLPASAEEVYPSRPIRIIVPFAPGGSTDALARIVADKLSSVLGQAAVVENRPGAGGNIGMNTVARSAPDGYTLALVSSSLVINPALYPKVPYDAVTDFEPISYVASAPSVLVVPTSVPAGSLAELVALGKKPPGLLYGSPGIGTAQHLAGELFKFAAGIELTHVPYNGAGPVVTAVLGSQVQMAFASLPSVQSFVAQGQLRTLAITSLTRSPAAPDVPTFDELGYKGFEVDHLQGLLAPKGTPRPIVERLSSAVHRVLQMPDVVDKLAKLGFEPVGNAPGEFAGQITVQLVKWDKLIKQAGIKLQ
ncbi:tripartite tricarboxylate transporter substrate binding protein [Microbacteriaceae bacterium K1510]|nr:tripartite tricarboxylate transporter substrate binding protein [Microbacteriaceae bacterium K1510]